MIIDWEKMAKANGWVEVSQDPHRGAEDYDGPCLYHEDQDRVWPLGDWEGAARDLGLDEDDTA